MISSYKIGPDGKVEVKTPYLEPMVDQCRKWGGKYDKTRGWVLPASRLDSVKEFLGDPATGTVEVEIGKGEVDYKGKQYAVGWFVLADRPARDRGCDLYADLVAGEIPERGGSVKYPLVSASDDAAFRPTVPRDFAESRGLKVVSAPAEPANPLAGFTDEEVRAEFARRGLTIG